VFEEDLVVRGADPSEALRPAPRAGASGNGIAEFADGFVADQGPWRLLLHVDPRYRPSGCSITRADGSAADLRLENVADGAAAIAVDAIEPGEWQLVATVHDERRSAHLDLPARPVRVLEGPVELRVPRVARDAFLVELSERAVLEVQGTSVAQGAAWELRPADARLVRGRVWMRVGDALVARELGVPGAAPQALLPASAIGRGWHEILVELEDVLGRPVRVLAGEEPAELVDGPSGAKLALVARFFAHDAPLRPAQSVANFEYGQPLSLTLASELPPRDGFAWRILVGETSVPCTRATRTAYGEELRFDVPFDVAAAATDMLALGTAEFAAGRDARLDVRVTSPAGPSELRIPVRTIRTTLRALTLADLRGDLPPEIGSILLVPVTGPGVGRAFKDPVPAPAPGRSRYRPSAPIDVRNVPDVYLQDQELTWEQYEAIVATGLVRVASLPPQERARLAAADDPLGAARWTSAALAPRAAQLVAGRAKRPVVGIDFRQAVAVTRLLGFLVADDPDFVRLPLGVELELAAFGAGERTGTALHGAAARGGGLDARALRATGADVGSVARWPPTRVEAEALGDVVSTELGDRITGLDLGAREWVLDVPCPPPDARGRALVLEWRADHPRHLERIALATAKREPDELGVFVGNRAILRGQATGEDPAIPSDENGRVPPDWPGVVRELQMRRDGGGLAPGEPDPHLGLAGLRIAGGERFVAEVRAR
ncbi:MAG: hypothetical protein HZB39_19950, partial [Planctomycetes bacterium]|nr:hypothetical protein [Planctomycetota bacterium]